MLVLAFLPRDRFITRSGPYPLHADEALMAAPAARMIKRGELNPRWFQYPSLPIYLTAASFLAGRAIDGDTQTEVGNVGRPYYARPTVVLTARYTFLFFSLTVFVLIGFLAVRATKESALLALAPLCLLPSDRFLIQSAAYLNVDIVGTLICTFAVLLAFLTRERSSLLYRAILPGLITGFAISSKYYLGLIGLPFAIILLDKRHRDQLARNARVIVFTTVIGFLMTTPYAVLDHETFLEDVLSQVAHYSEGHAGSDGEPGLGQLIYYGGQLKREFGIGLLGFALIGLVSLIKKDRKSAFLLLSFPVALLAFLATQRVHFPRNIISVYALFPIFAAFGMTTAIRGLGGLALPVGRRVQTVFGGVLVVLVLYLTVPWERARASFTAPIDSRSRVVEWIEKHRAKGDRVYVAAELQMDLRPLEAYSATDLPLGWILDVGMVKRYAAENPVFVLPEIVPGTRFASMFGKRMKPADELEVRARYGNNLVPRHTNRQMHMGDPRLQIYELPKSGNGGARSAVGRKKRAKKKTDER